ncbi:hypothetical protein KUCAC02_021468 [Chaenocephalus aceratus]|uniref:Uncharacterized protein n=1 Tax=Chaenocephalus aceratus TaxID=36190 RepID=A0ACB9XGU4_CHAAC|nr:hypothetical protein KUCAC02_021468 [Chaenocephalus aceratus]
MQSFHELRGKARSVWVRRWLSEKRRERYGHYSTLLNELKTEDEKAFFNYTRLPRGLYDEVLRRVEGRIEKKDTWYRKSLPPGLKLSITLRHLASGYTSALLASNGPLQEQQKEKEESWRPVFPSMEHLPFHAMPS